MRVNSWGMNAMSRKMRMSAAEIQKSGFLRS